MRRRTIENADHLLTFGNRIGAGIGADLAHRMFVSVLAAFVLAILADGERRPRHGCKVRGLVDRKLQKGCGHRGDLISRLRAPGEARVAKVLQAMIEASEAVCTHAAAAAASGVSDDP